ncbi:MAG: alkaline shock response membrane anchor protein AmaP [Firmicutes bacterium]|nr:alkaline shock response membrane anchor protein AmaP [Bacillota bacterium]
MRLIDRIVLVLSVVITAVLAAGVLVSTAGNQFPSDFALRAYDVATRNRIPTALGGVLVVLVMLYVLVLALRPEREPKSIVSATALGDVRISMTAVETLARKVAKHVRGIRDVEAIADGASDGLAIVMKLQVYPDVSIPQVCEELERELAEFIRFAVGVPVKAVHTVVKSVAHDQSKPRV